MKHCANPSCPYRSHHPRPAEYQDSASLCSDCGQPLSEGAPTAPALEAGTAAPSRPWTRLAVTLAAAVAAFGAQLVPLPGLGLANVRGLQSLGLFALGLTPVVSAFVVVELAALAVPRWRMLRLTGSEGRRRMRPALVCLAALFAIAQATGMASLLRSIEAGSPGLSIEPWAPWAALGLMPLATLALVLLARVVDRWGLGSGFAVVLVAPLLFDLVASMVSAGPYLTPFTLVVALAIVCGVVALTWRALRHRKPFVLEGKPFTVELPACGIAPLTVAASLLLLPASVMPLLGGDVPRSLSPGTGTYALGFLLLAAGFAAALSLLFNRPSRVARVWQGTEASTGQQAPAVRAQIVRASRASAAFVLGVGAIDLLPPLFFSVPIVVRALPMIAVAAVLLDAWEEWSFRSRHARLSGAWLVQRVYAVAPALDALASAGIEAFPRGLRYRTLLQFFGPFVPVTLLVPETRVGEAERIVRERLLEPDRQGKTEAIVSDEPTARLA